MNVKGFVSHINVLNVLEFNIIILLYIYGIMNVLDIFDYYTVHIILYYYETSSLFYLSIYTPCGGYYCA